MLAMLEGMRAMLQGALAMLAWRGCLQKESRTEQKWQRNRERERKNGCVRQGDAGIEHNRMRDRERNEEG